MNADLPVLPVAHNAGKFWPKTGWAKRPGTITVTIGAPIYAEAAARGPSPSSMTGWRPGMNRLNGIWAHCHHWPLLRIRLLYELLWITCVRLFLQGLKSNYKSLIYIYISQAHKMWKNVHKFFSRQKNRPWSRFFSPGIFPALHSSSKGSSRMKQEPRPTTLWQLIRP